MDAKTENGAPATVKTVNILGKGLELWDWGSSSSVLHPILPRHNCLDFQIFANNLGLSGQPCPTVEFLCHLHLDHLCPCLSELGLEIPT